MVLVALRDVETYFRGSIASAVDKRVLFNYVQSPGDAELDFHYVWPVDMFLVDAVGAERRVFVLAKFVDLNMTLFSAIASDKILNIDHVL